MAHQEFSTFQKVSYTSDALPREQRELSRKMHFWLRINSGIPHADRNLTGTFGQNRSEILSSLISCRLTVVTPVRVGEPVLNFDIGSTGRMQSCENQKTSQEN